MIESLTVETELSDIFHNTVYPDREVSSRVAKRSFIQTRTY